MFPRRVCHGARSSATVDKTRCDTNRIMPCVLRWRNGITVSQLSITPGFQFLFLVNGIHLSEKGCDLYLQNLVERIRDFVENLWWK